jgi:uncharacterized protein (DUF488 family)
VASVLPVFTIGHSTRSIPEFVRLLGAGEVRLVVDIRRIPRSRTNPQYDADRLPAELAPFGIGHLRIAELGGLRKKSGVEDDVNAFWTSSSFKNYADYALSEEFRSGFDRLLDLAAGERTAIMCAESVWWRCHRRIVADYLLCAGRPVFHLMNADDVVPAHPSDGAVCVAGGVHYPAASISREKP